MRRIGEACEFRLFNNQSCNLSVVDALPPSKRYPCLRYLTLKAAHEAEAGSAGASPPPAGVRAIDVHVPTPGGSRPDSASPLLSFEVVLVVFGAPSYAYSSTFLLHPSLLFSRTPHLLICNYYLNRNSLSLLNIREICMFKYEYLPIFV